MTEQEAKIKELELRVKELEDKVFNQWLSQYEPKTNRLNYWSTVYDVGYTGPVSKYNPELEYSNKETK